MGEKYEIIDMLQNRYILNQVIEDTIYGSVEIREKDGYKYIYVHYREDGISLTKYVGEYTDELYNMIITNNAKVKAIKKELKRISKRLNELNYKEHELDDVVSLNIDFAKRYLVDTIYKQAILEGVATTYADAESIIEGGKIKNMNSVDVMKIVNLKHAWELILNKNIIEVDSNLALLCEINRYIEDGFYFSAGRLRGTPVAIGGTTWKPEIPIESKVKEELEEIVNSNISNVDKAIELLLFVMKKQLFLDGNKRAAVIFANHYLIARGLGLIVIPEDKIDEFKDLLITFYEGKGKTKIKTFLKKECYRKLKKW